MGWNTEEVREKARRREACDAGCETNGTIATGVVEIKRSRRSVLLATGGLTEGMGRSGMKKREERGKGKKKKKTNPDLWIVQSARPVKTTRCFSTVVAQKR